MQLKQFEMYKRKGYNKYGAKKCSLMGASFDSRLEGNRAIFLLGALKEGKIRNLRRQVEFELIPKQTYKVEKQLKTKVKEVERVAEQKCCYVADFVYEKKEDDGTWQTVVEDTKSKVTRTADYIIKRKLMLFRHGIRIREITKPGEDI